jgi:hypothetical protein
MTDPSSLDACERRGEPGVDIASTVHLPVDTGSVPVRHAVYEVGKRLTQTPPLRLVGPA